MRRYVPFALLILAGCGALGKPSKPTLPADPIEHDLDFEIDGFELIERSGKTVTDQDLRGQVWVGSFIFTRCNGPCPAVTSTMQRLQLELADELNTGQFKLVTFTVDPARDDLKALNEYADARKADSANWLFLTGDEKTVHELLQKQFKQAVQRNLGPDVKEGDEFGHSTRLIVVDKKGVIRAMFDGLPNADFPNGREMFEAGLGRLKERVRELMK